MDLNSFAEGLKERPSYHSFAYSDVNPLGGQMKLRILNNPNKALRAIHGRLREYLEEVEPELEHATGARKGCSPRKNVLIHQHNRYFFLTDIVDAYLSVDVERMTEVLVGLDSQLKAEEVKSFLRKYCFRPEDGLLIGAPASPDLYNLYAGVLLDIALGEFCKKRGLVYTRYLDDITISSSDENGPIGKRKRKELRLLIKAAGFELKDSKTKVLDLAKGPITINGIGLELGGRIFLPGRYRRFLCGLAHKAYKDPSISLSQVAGRMGVFWGTKGPDRLHLTRSEKKLVRRFDALRARVRARARAA